MTTGTGTDSHSAELPDAPEPSAESVEPNNSGRHAAASTRTRRGGALGFLRDVAVIVVAAVVLSFLIKTFLVRSFYIPSASMENTLQINDRIMVNQLVPRVFGLSRGDVVVFTDPGGWLAGESAPSSNLPPLQQFVENALSVVGLTAPDSNNHLIKRVIGLPGDHVSCCNAQGQIMINGVGVNEPYVLLAPGETKASGTSFDVTVPAGELFVMGDNRYNSRDSRYQTGTPLHGFVPISDVVGQAFVLTWPVSRWTWLGNYSDEFKDVPKPTANSAP